MVVATKLRKLDQAVAFLHYAPMPIGRRRAGLTPASAAAVCIVVVVVAAYTVAVDAVWDHQWWHHPVLGHVLLGLDFQVDNLIIDDTVRAAVLFVWSGNAGGRTLDDDGLPVFPSDYATNSDSSVDSTLHPTSMRSVPMLTLPYLGLRTPSPCP